MSVKKPQLYFILFLSLSFGLYQFFKAPVMIRKSFATGINVSEYSSRGVTDRTILLKLDTSDLSKNKVDVIAQVSVPFNFNEELRYKWTLGQNVVLKQGVLEGSIGKGLKKDTLEKISIQVQGFNINDRRHIGFEIWGTKNGRRIYADGLISSQKENSFENIVQNVERLKAEKSGIRK